MNAYGSCVYCGGAYVPDTDRPGSICDSCLEDCCVVYLTHLYPEPPIASLHECEWCGKEWVRVFDGGKVWVQQAEGAKRGYEEVLW